MIFFEYKYVPLHSGYNSSLKVVFIVAVMVSSSPDSMGLTSVKVHLNSEGSVLFKNAFQVCI